VGVLEAFADYSVGFMARPIGAMIFGHYGDRIGRKGALVATLLLTGLATFAIGFVPTYDQVGIWGAGEAIRRARKLARKKAQREGLIAAPKGKKVPPRRPTGWPPFAGAAGPPRLP